MTFTRAPGISLGDKLIADQVCNGIAIVLACILPSVPLLNLTEGHYF